MNKILSFALALIWLGVANHCYIMEAAASPAQSTHQCCPDSTKKSNLPSGPHAPASDKICCQLLFNTSTNVADLAVPHFQVIALLLPPQFQFRNPIVEAFLRPNYAILFHPPPGGRLDFLVSLTLAPNAPPASL